MRERVAAAGRVRARAHLLVVVQCRSPQAPGPLSTLNVSSPDNGCHSRLLSMAAACGTCLWRGLELYVSPVSVCVPCLSLSMYVTLSLPVSVCVPCLSLSMYVSPVSACLCMCPLSLYVSPVSVCLCMCPLSLPVCVCVLCLCMCPCLCLSLYVSPVSVCVCVP